MLETASSTRRGTRSEAPASPLDIPQFRQFLKQSHLTLAQWEAQQPKPDLNSAALSLQKRKLSLNKGK